MTEPTFIATAISIAYGPRCAEKIEGCPTCDAWAQYDALSDAHAALTACQQEVERLLTLNADLTMQAKGHAQEARTANSTIYEIYQAISGAKGEPGNWNGAQPVIEYIETAETRVAQLEEAIGPFAADAGIYDPDDMDGSEIAWMSKFRIEQLRHARSALGGQSNG